MTNAVGYMRCSGEGQREGDTWNRQTLAIERFAASTNHQIVEWFRDEGVPGKTELEGRSGLSACLHYIQENNISVVICESSDRLARDMIISEVIVREFQKIGVTVYSASGGVNLTEGDDSNPTAKLIRQILAAIAEFDKSVIVLKLRGARERIRTEIGKCEGRKGFGQDPDRPEESSILQEMTLASKMATPQEIARLLNEQGVRTRYGKKWTATTVSRILARHQNSKIAA